MIVDRNFQTPIPVVNYMIDLIPPSAKTILEPAPGFGNITQRLTNYEVTAAGDFFLMDKNQRFDCVVMNPPFSAKTAYLVNAPEGFNKLGMRLGYYFLTECMKMSNNIIALMPWMTISDSDVRMRTIMNYGMKSLTALPRKTFEFARIQTCVFELEKDFKGETIFRAFDLPHQDQVKLI